MAVTTKQNPRFSGAKVSASDPAVDALAFTGTADVTLETYSRGVYIGTAGDLKVDMIGFDGNAGVSGVTFASLVAGTILPICISKIYDAGTTASGVILI